MSKVIMKPSHSHITLEGLELAVNLGWPDSERSEKQTVWLDLRFAFPEQPLGCTTDNLADTYCYDTLVTHIRNAIATKPFRLIEHLGHEIYQAIQTYLPPDMKIQLRVKKQTAIPLLNGGVTFYFGDDSSPW